MNTPQPPSSPAPRRGVRRPIPIVIGLLVVVTIVVIGAAVISSTQTPVAGPVSITLTPPPKLSDLATQFPALAGILSDPELNSAYKDFLVAYQQDGLAAATDLARQRGLLTAQGEIAATLILDADYTADLIAQLEAIGVTVGSAYKTRVDIAVPIELIQKSIDSGDPGAVFAQLTELQHVIRIQLPKLLKPGTLHLKPHAQTTGQGVQLIGAEAWHAAGLTGTDVRVGILDCGFKGYTALLGVELPIDVEVKTFVRGLSDPNLSQEKHGTAVAEIMHEVAPDAQLFMADYGCQGGPTQGRAVNWLLAQDVQIISDSTGNAAAPMDGTGWDADLVKDATDKGVLWINSAGNEAERHYRGQYADANGNQFHDFKPDQETLSFRPDEPVVDITLRWDDWAKADQDFDLNLLDADGNRLAAAQESQSGAVGDTPVEEIVYTGLTPGATYHVAIYAARADRAVTFDLYFEGEVALEFSTSDYSLISPADASDALAVGAVNWSADRITDYSSRGPTADGRVKPDLAAPSEVDNVTYQHFGGTSAAAPHVAGAAALVWGAFPSLDRQQVWDYLMTNALDRGPAGLDDTYGAGRLQLPASITSTLTATATAAPTATPTLVAPMTPTAVAPLGVTPTATLPVSGTVTPTLTPSVIPPGTMVIPTMLVVIGGGLIGLLVISLVIVLLRRGRRPKSSLPKQPAPHLPPSGLPTPHTPTVTAPTVAAPSVACPHCGQPVRVGAKFCAACGQSMAGQPPSAMPQQRPAAPPPASPAARSPQLPKGPAPQPPKPGAPQPPQVMVYCKQCGTSLRPGAKFCAKCGTRQ
jgi:subtilisin family serine protease